MIVREVVPRVPVRTVVLAHRAPLTLGQVGAPLLPFRFGQPRMFCRGILHGATPRVKRERSARDSIRVSTVHARSVSDTPHACATQPRDVWGASPSKISLIVPRQA